MSFRGSAAPKRVGGRKRLLLVGGDSDNEDGGAASAADASAHGAIARAQLPSALCHPSLELSDPQPDVRELFLEYNLRFFHRRLDAVEVAWSKRMTLCAGICYNKRAGGVIVRLSEPLLKLRPRSDLINTLLHECIHAYLFVTGGNQDRDGHGGDFQTMMHSINSNAGTHITVYHSFHDEVKSLRTHVWRCSGPCRERAPFFGWCRRAMNRAPGPTDTWWKAHAASCTGKFEKVSEPEPKVKKSKGKQGATAGNADGSSARTLDSFVTRPPKAAAPAAAAAAAPTSSRGYVLGGSDVASASGSGMTPQQAAAAAARARFAAAATGSTARNATREHKDDDDEEEKDLIDLTGLPDASTHTVDAVDDDDVDVIALQMGETACVYISDGEDEVAKDTARWSGDEESALPASATVRTSLEVPALKKPRLHDEKRSEVDVVDLT